MKGRLAFELHPREKTLEDYWFNRLQESVVAPLEEHLLVCERCQRDLEELDEYILLMKAATAEGDIVQPPVAPGPGPPGGSRRVLQRVRFTPSWPIWATAMGLAAAVVILSSREKPPAAAAPVSLTAIRGAGDASEAHAPAGRPLDLSISAADLPSTSPYRLEVVDETGRRIWDGAVRASEGKLTAELPGNLTAGKYWVRLYSGPGVLVREFSLRLN